MPDRQEIFAAYSSRGKDRQATSLELHGDRIELRLVDAVHGSGANETAENLGYDVGRDLFGREALEDPESDSCAVLMSDCKRLQATESEDELKQGER